jgi:hypothetical protein
MNIEGDTQYPISVSFLKKLLGEFLHRNDQEKSHVKLYKGGFFFLF